MAYQKKYNKKLNELREILKDNRTAYGCGEGDGYWNSVIDCIVEFARRNPEADQERSNDTRDPNVQDNLRYENRGDDIVIHFPAKKKKTIVEVDGMIIDLRTDRDE